MWRGEVTSELRHIAQSIRDLQRQVAEVRAAIGEQFEEHRAHHAANEHKWGFARWCQLHPFQFVMLAALAAAAVLMKSNLIGWSAVLRLVRDVIR